MPTPPATLAVRPFTPDLHGQVVDLVTAIQTREFAIPITLADQPDLIDPIGFYRRGAGEFWVAMDRARVVGTIGLVDGGDRIGSLRKMFVHERSRGTGVAARLLHTLLDHARAHGFTAVVLGTTAVMAAAHRFYEKHGFREIAQGEVPPSASYAHVDSKFYRCSLT